MRSTSRRSFQTMVAISARILIHQCHEDFLERGCALAHFFDFGAVSYQRGDDGAALDPTFPESDAHSRRSRSRHFQRADGVECERRLRATISTRALCTRARTSSGGPAANERAPSNDADVTAQAFRSSRLCVVRKMLVPSRSASTARSSRSAAAAIGSRPAVGSSRNTVSGRCRMARATASFCFMPRLHVLTASARRSHKTELSSSWRMRACRSARDICQIRPNKSRLSNADNLSYRPPCSKARPCVRVSAGHACGYPSRALRPCRSRFQ